VGTFSQLNLWVVILRAEDLSVEWTFSERGGGGVLLEVKFPLNTSCRRRFNCDIFKVVCEKVSSHFVLGAGYVFGDSAQFKVRVIFRGRWVGRI